RNDFAGALHVRRLWSAPDLQTGNVPRATEQDQFDGLAHPRFESDGRARGNIESVTGRGVSVEAQRRIRVREVQMRTDLHRPITVVDNDDRLSITARVQLHRGLTNTDLAGDHTIGSVIVTSLRPSGNVAST